MYSVAELQVVAGTASTDTNAVARTSLTLVDTFMLQDFDSIAPQIPMGSDNLVLNEFSIDYKTFQYTQTAQFVPVPCSQKLCSGHTRSLQLTLNFQ